MLYGREDELACLAGMIADARDHRRSGAIVLRGEAGIGKSALLDHIAAMPSNGDGQGAPDGAGQNGDGQGASDAAASSPDGAASGPDGAASGHDTASGQDGAASGQGGGPGMRVLRLAGIEVEAGMAFAGLSQLLWPVRDRIGALPPAQAGALRGALRLPLPDGAPDGAAAQDRFTTGLALLTLLADLADEAPVLCLVDDAQWLDTATAEALLFAARRLAAEGVVMVFATREAEFTGTGLPEQELNRLDPDRARQLLDGLDLPGPMRERVLREAAGNPLALLEFGSGRPRMPSVSAPLPVADRVVAAFRGQIGGLPESTRLMLLIAAAEGRGHMPSLLAAARDFGISLADLEEAERARLVQVTGTTIAFRHPLIRAAAYQGASTARRVAVHQALAVAADDPDCRARHRASSAMSPDEDVAAELERAAVRAVGCSGHGVAAVLYRQAAELTPDHPARAARLGAAAAATLQAGHPLEADELAAGAERFTDDPAARARLARVRAAVEFERGDPRAAARMLVEHAGRAAPDDVLGLLRTAATYAWTSGEAPAVLRAADLLRSSGLDDLTIRGMACLVSGDYAHGLPLLAELIGAERAALGPAPDGGDGARGDDRTLVAQLGLILGDDEAALELTAAEAARCRGQGLIAALPNVLQAQAQVQISVGRHQDAEATVAEAIALARDTGFARREGRLGAVLARVAAIEGDEVRLRELIEHAPLPGGGFADCALSLLDLALGRYDDALRRLEDVAQGPRRHTAGVMLSAADLIESAVRAGRPEQARPAMDHFRGWAEAGGQPWALAVAARCEALLDDSEAPYVRALHLHDQAMRPFEQARTQLLYGEWLRRARRRSDARVPLRTAVETFERLRAAPWTERARAELRATGESGTAAAPTAPDLMDRLTPQELQVVRLAAEGTSSRDIAAHLFLSPRTVEYHLYKAYPKLGISSRRELSRLQLETAAAG